MRITPEIQARIDKLQIWYDGESKLQDDIIPPAIWAVVWPNGDYLELSSKSSSRQGTGATYNPALQDFYGHPCCAEEGGILCSSMGRLVAFEALPEDRQEAILEHWPIHETFLD